MYEKLLTKLHKFSKAELFCILLYKLSHNVYYVRNAVGTTRYNRL